MPNHAISRCFSTSPVLDRASTSAQVPYPSSFVGSSSSNTRIVGWLAIQLSDFSQIHSRIQLATSTSYDSSPQSKDWQTSRSALVSRLAESCTAMLLTVEWNRRRDRLGALSSRPMNALELLVAVVPRSEPHRV